MAAGRLYFVQFPRGATSLFDRLLHLAETDQSTGSQCRGPVRGGGVRLPGLSIVGPGLGTERGGARSLGASVRVLRRSDRRRFGSVRPLEIT